MADLGGLLNIFGAAPSYASGLLSEEELDSAKSRARANALLQMGQAFYKAGAPRETPGGSALSGIAGALLSGQKAYQGAIKGSLEEKLNDQKIQDALNAKKRQTTIQGLISGAYQPAQAGQAAQPAPYLAGAPYGKATPAIPAQPARFNLEAIAPQLMQTAEGRAALADFAETKKAVNQLGLGGEGQMDNPFDMFLSDPSMPTALRNLAVQLSNSFKKGLIPPDKVDERVRQLAQLQQSASDRSAGREQQASMARLTASLRPERMVTVMDDSGQPITLPQSQAGNRPLYSPAASKAIQDKSSKNSAKEQLSALVADLGNDYSNLKKTGSIVSSGTSGLDNIGAKISSSGVGQFFGSTVGTEAQSTRQAIAQKRPLLLNLIKNATGMSAQQMNSNAEMQLYLQAATDPTLSYEANMSALENLDKMFGLGMFKAGEKSDDNPFGK